MPKVDIDYSNTLFYKISCKDTSITDLYIGHTTNFVQRKSGHKQSCSNPKSTNYNCKLYNVIRQHGGWDNWRMDIIAYHECNDQYEARKKEQEYFILYNATLNSIEPMPRPKCVNIPTIPVNQNDVKSTHLCNICKFSCFNTQDVFNLHLTRNRHIKAVSSLTRLSANVVTPSKEYKCEKCNFKCSKYSNYKTHLLTAKHLNRTSRTESSVSEFVCECGKKYTARNSLWYHKRVCKYTADAHTDDDAASQQPPHFDAMLVTELLKQNQEFKELLAEQTKHMIEQQQQLIEAVKDGKLGNSANYLQE